MFRLSIHRAKFTRSGRGFTLIELLVVIAIIAILAAILFPVFARARGKARETTCKSNMKQISLAVQMYCDDYKDCYPDQTSAGVAYRGTYDNGLGSLWIQSFSHRYLDDKGQPAGIVKALLPYNKSLKIYKCPQEWKDARKKTEQGIVWLPYSQGSSYYFKHALNFYANHYKRPIKSGEVGQASKVCMFYEEAWHSNVNNPLLWNQPKTSETKRVNVIFLDGHVGYIELPWNAAAGYDGNWFHYGGGATGFGWDVSQDARDIE